MPCVSSCLGVSVFLTKNPRTVLDHKNYRKFIRNSGFRTEIKTAGIISSRIKIHTGMVTAKMQNRKRKGSHVPQTYKISVPETTKYAFILFRFVISREQCRRI